MTMNRHVKILYDHQPAIRKSSLWQPQHSFPSALGRAPISLISLLSSLPFLHGCWFKIGCDTWWTLHDVNNLNQLCVTVSGPERKGERGKIGHSRVWEAGLSVSSKLKVCLPSSFPLNQWPLMWLKHFQGMQDSDWNSLFLCSSWINQWLLPMVPFFLISGPGSGSVHLLNFA